MNEIWKEIPGFNGNYSVSNLGTVRSNVKHTWNGKTTCTRKQKIIKSRIGNSGYERVSLSYCGKKKHYLVHRLVANAFIYNGTNLPTVNHINGTKTDNRVENLEWSSRSDQNKHAIKLGLKRVAGENHSQHKLKENDIIIIRGRFNSGESKNDIHKDYTIVSKATISDIVKRKSWRHL